MIYNPWYTANIEEPIRETVFLLRNNGFNTIWSCGHLPKPYIAVESYRENEKDLLEDLLLDNGFRNFTVQWKHYGAVNRELLAVTFSSIPEGGTEKTVETQPCECKLPETILSRLGSDSYRNYQPITGYDQTSLFTKAAYDRVIKDISQLGVNGKRILEPGPLFGYFSFELAKLGAEVTAVEHDKNKYDICVELAEHYGVSVNFVNEDIRNFDFRNTDFDMLLLMNLLHHLFFEGDYVGRSFIYRASIIPQMVLCMGTSLGGKHSGISQDMIPNEIFKSSRYKYAKKISELKNRCVYFFG